jgi:catechol 2,3-dioxygenase-like lactoylglutathione lyase family enzyme
MMPADHFGFSKLVVCDLQKCAAFYKSVCRLTEQARVDAEIEGRAISEIMFNPTEENAATFVLLTYRDTPKPALGESIVGFISKDVSAFVERARAAGGKIVQEVAPRPEHGVDVAFVRDPEGHLIEVVQVV